MKYYKELDTLRAFAVTLVIISHWLPQSFIATVVPAGSVGVCLFFVLSGYLVTKILLENSRDQETKMPLIKSFYARRSLRIFPIYYIFVTAVYLFASKLRIDVSGSFAYYLTYTSNFYLFHRHAWDGFLSHLWSLAVEEQFYLLWPWLIIFSPRKYLPFIIGVFIAIGVVFEVVLISDPMGQILTFSCFSALGFGALVASFDVYPDRREKFLRILYCSL